MKMIQLNDNKPLANTPTYCACRKDNSTSHGLDCKKGGFVSLRHDQIRDLTIAMRI